MTVSIQTIGLDGVVVEIGRLPRGIERFVINGLGDIAHEQMRQGAGRHSPRPTGTGRLYKSLFKDEDFGAARVTVGHDTTIAPHAIFVLRRTKPHEIKQRTGGPMLSWIDYGGGENSTRIGSGKRFFARSVWHPGYRGDRYDERAEQEALRNFRRIVEAAFAKAATP